MKKFIIVNRYHYSFEHGYYNPSPVVLNVDTIYKIEETIKKGMNVIHIRVNGFLTEIYTDYSLTMLCDELNSK